MANYDYKSMEEIYVDEQYKGTCVGCRIEGQVIRITMGKKNNIFISHRKWINFPM